LEITLEKIIDPDNMHDAFISARRGKRNKQSIFNFEVDVFTNLEKLSEEIREETYSPIKPRRFEISCTAGQKTRVIDAPSFRDSVVQHAIYNIIYPVFDRGFIFDSYGCRIGKGTHKCANRCQEYVRKHNGDKYYLQIDIRKFYHNIQHSKIKESLQRKIKDIRVVNLIMKFCFRESGVGLGIGFLLSQLFGLIYLDRFDHFVKRKLKIKHYLRYVDDMVFIGLSLKEVKVLYQAVLVYLREELCLTLSKWKISKIKKGVNFVGYRTWKSCRFIRKRTLNTFSRSLKKNKYKSLQSILAHAKYTTSYKYLCMRIIATIPIQSITKLFGGIIRYDLFLYYIQDRRAKRYHHLLSTI